MTALTIYLVFGFMWLLAGIQEWRIAVLHARLYNYKPRLFVAYYWLMASALFLVAAAIVWSTK